MEGTQQESVTNTRDKTTMDQVLGWEIGKDERAYQSRVLDEFPGVAFVAIALVWLITILIW